MTVTDPRIHTHHLRVRYAETDQMGVAHHASFVPWMEVGRIEWLRERGLSYAKLEQEGFLLPVTHLDLRYRRPARFDQELKLQTFLVELGACRLLIRNRLYDLEDTLLAEGSVELAAVGPGGRLRRIPEALHAQLSAQLIPPGDGSLS